MSSIPALPVPAINELPFIDDSFAEAVSLARDSDGACGSESHAQDISNAEVAAYHNLSEHAFAGLATLLGMHTFGQPIRAKEDLAAMANQKHEEFEDEECCEIDLHDLEAFLALSSGVKSSGIRWDKIAALHNESDDADRQAIRTYFNKAFENDLAYTLSIRGPSIDIPQSLRHHEAGVQFGDKLFFQAPEDKSWVSEDSFHTRFRVTAVIVEKQGSTVFSNPLVIAVSGYLDEAIAMASVYVKKRMYMDEQHPNNTVSSISISLGRESVAVASLVEDRSSTASARSHKLIWECAAPVSEHSRLNEQQKELRQKIGESHSRNESPDPLYKEIDKVNAALMLSRTHVTDEMFKSARLRAEEALKLDWGKVHDLESALGL